MKSLSDCYLYTFVDFAYLQDRSPIEIAQQLCEGGSDLIQLRAKDLAPSAILRAAEQLLVITERAGIGLVINDYPDIAVKVGAPLCHLGQEDFFHTGKHHLSQLLPASSTLKTGLSSHTPAQAKRALAAGANYLAVGPVYATPTKPAAAAVTLDYVRWAATNLSVPWFAIGGINLQNLKEVMRAGARRICVVSAILNAPNIVEDCQAFKKRLSCVPVETKS
jgi:thiamine-phosphate pyrophosphorylase